jgi:hypothetical protein
MWAQENEELNGNGMGLMINFGSEFFMLFCKRKNDFSKKNLKMCFLSVQCGFSRKIKKNHHFCVNKDIENLK